MGFDWFQFYANQGLRGDPAHFCGFTGLRRMVSDQRLQSWRTAIDDVSDAGAYVTGRGRRPALAGNRRLVRRLCVTVRRSTRLVPGRGGAIAPVTDLRTARDDGVFQ
jgi:hypothetical protein